MPVSSFSNAFRLRKNALSLEATDFRQRRFLPSNYHYGYHQMRYHNLLSSYLKYPEDSVWFALYTASLEVAERIVRENYEIFNDAGFVVSLGERDADAIIQRAIIQRAASQDKDRIKGEPMSFPRDYGDTLKETSRAKRRLEQTETAQFPPKRRNSSRHSYVIPSCSMEEWKNGKAKQECIEAWNELPNVPLRTFQSFTYPTMWKSKESKLTQEERDFRSRYGLCIRCGNHLASGQRTPHQIHPFYERFRCSITAETLAT